jgi:hypothetical protein
MNEPAGQSHRDQLVHALEDARNTEEHLRESLINNPSAASTLEPQIADAMKRVLKLQDDLARLRANDAKLAEHNQRRL